MKLLRRGLTRIGVSTSHPLSFAVVGIYVAAWLALDPRSFGWQGAATVATWLMTLFIQRAEHRDTQAIHAKLDELLRVEGRARNEFTAVDRKEPEEIAAQRASDQRKEINAT
jgi:low affinity Fe/Cu permease